jgi:hypothetical protein
MEPLVMSIEYNPPEVAQKAYLLSKIAIDVTIFISVNTSHLLIFTSFGKALVSVERVKKIKANLMIFFSIICVIINSKMIDFYIKVNYNEMHS